MFTEDYRIAYYLDNLKEQIITYNKNISGFRFDKIFITNYNDLSNNDLSNNAYFVDMKNYVSNMNSNKHSKNFLCVFGDSVNHDKNYPIFTKARKINDGYNKILLKLNSNYHCNMLKNIKNIDIPFSSKNNKLLWRGTLTGKHVHGLRHLIVKKFQNHANKNIDIKFYKSAQHMDVTGYNIVPKLSYTEQLKFKFIISIEGNDVATNLKWALLSNSVVLMPECKIASWFMEDHLIPYVHYIPLSRDFEDLEAKYEWCLNNLKDCEQISKNATLYMERFMNEDVEKRITTKVIDAYLDKISIINIP